MTLAVITFRFCFAISSKVLLMMVKKTRFGMLMRDEMKALVTLKFPEFDESFPCKNVPLKQEFFLYTLSDSYCLKIL